MIRELVSETAHRSLTVTPIDDHNAHVYSNLSQSYEAEFSRMTHKLPNENGLYEITPCDAVHQGFLLWLDYIPVGFALVNTSLSRYDITEFYVIPGKRKAGFGKYLAHWVFCRYPGNWQVRQILGADSAYQFWIQTIHEFSNGDFTDAKEPDSEWGTVTVQRFKS